MKLPTLAKRHLRDRYAHLSHPNHVQQSDVAYFHGCAANYFDDGVGDAVIGLLEDRGVNVALPPQRCSEPQLKRMAYENSLRRVPGSI